MHKYRNLKIVMQELVQKGLMEVKAPFALFASYISYIKHSSYLISPRDVD
jgi:hypothetical protein